MVKIWKKLSPKIDACIDFVGCDINYVLNSVITNRIDFLSPKQKQMFGYMLAPAYRPLMHILRGEGKATTILGHAKLEFIALLESNLTTLATELKDSDYVPSRSVELAAYKDIAKKAARVFSKKCPVNSLAILLHGPKGVGKTFFASYITLALGESYKRLSLYDKSGVLMSVSEIQTFISGTFSNIFLIDEVDTLVDKEGVLPLLHALLDDIRNKSSKTMIIMTTNHIEKLIDLPLCREGRVDIIKEIGDVSQEDAAAICQQWDLDWDDIKHSINGHLTVAKIAQACRDVVMVEIKGE